MSRDFLPEFLLLFESIWAPDKQDKKFSVLISDEISKFVLRGVYDTAESDSALSCTPRIFINIRISNNEKKVLNKS